MNNIFEYHGINIYNSSMVRTVLMLVNIVAEYCFHAEEIPVCAESLLRYVSDLLVQFNSKCYKLILGGEALSEKTGLKKITSTNMALLLRALHLVLWLIPHVRVHFQGNLGHFCQVVTCRGQVRNNNELGAVTCLRCW